MRKIIFLDQGTLSGQEFKFDFPYELTNIENCSPDHVANAIQGQDIIITNKVSISREAMEKNPQLQLIAVAATGFNLIDIKAANELGITVCNVADYSRVSVAEHAFMMMISLMHRLPLYQKRIYNNEWQKSPFFSIIAEPIFDLEGKTLGIVGKGSIGSKLAQYAKAFGMTVLFSERKDESSIREGYTDFNTVLELADVYSLHVPMTGMTNNMIDEDEIARMKNGAIIINVSRGGLVNENALAESLRSRKLGGAGVDVTSTEPPKKDNPLLADDLGNFILTPHTAWSSQEAIARLMTILEDNINSFVKGSPINVVN